MSRFVALTHPWIDSSNAPIYEVRFPVKASDDDVRSFAEARESWMRRANYSVSWVVDLTNLSSVPASQRRMFAEHLTRFEPHDVAHNRGSAIVVPNAFLRGIVTAVFWISNPKFPHKAFEVVEDARAWARERLGPRSEHPPEAAY